MKKGLVIFGLCLLVMMSFVSAEIIYINPSDTLRACTDFKMECGNFTNGEITNTGETNILVYDCGECKNGLSCSNSNHKCVNFSKLCADSYIKCGTWSDGVGGEFACGTCNSGKCIAGKCYSFSELGNCISFNEKYGIGKPTCANQQFDVNMEESSKEKICQAVGCNYNPNNSTTCEGTPTSCSTLKEDCLTGLAQSCIWENNDLYTPKMYWKGKGVLTPAGWLTVSVDKDFIKNPDISIFMVLENSKLPEGTPVNFEIYKQEGFKFYEIRIASTAIPATIDKDGNAVAEWMITADDLANANYNGNDRIDFEVIVNGKHFSGSPGIPMTEAHDVENSVNIDKKSLLLVTKKGECSGTISCSAFSSKWECNEVETGNCNWNDATGSCSGAGISCSIIGDGDTCQTWKCSWKGYSWWKIFTDWFSSLFGN